MGILVFSPNRIIFQEVAVNGQFLPRKSNFFVKLPEKKGKIKHHIRTAYLHNALPI